MTGARIDALTMLALAASVAALLVVVLHRWPQAALAAWLAVLALVPSWLTLTLVVPVQPASAIGVVAVAAMLPVSFGRIVWADGLALFLLVACLVPFPLGLGTLSTFVTVLVTWLVGYLLGRLAPLRLGLDRTYRWIAAVCTAVAAGAVVEFILRWNPFIDLARPGGEYDTWGTLQERGGLVRAEWAFGHSIALGATLALAVPITLACSWRLSARIAMTVTLFAGIVVTFSRTALLCAVIGLILSVLLLRSETGFSVRARVGVVIVSLIGTIAVAPWVAGVFADAGEEAAGSAAYRWDLFSLLPRIESLGTSDLATTSDLSRQLASGSIDNAWLLLGLRYGAIPLVLISVALVGAVATVLLRRATPATIAIVAHLPAVFTVALITQYEIWFWFVAGLAAASQALAAGRRQQTGPRPTQAFGRGENVMSSEPA